MKKILAFIAILTMITILLGSCNDKADNSTGDNGENSAAASFGSDKGTNDGKDLLPGNDPNSIINSDASIIDPEMLLPNVNIPGSEEIIDDQSTKDFEAEVIKADTGLLVAPDMDSSEYRSSDQIAVGLNGTIINDQQGNRITLQELKAGDLVKIYYNGIIAESYPAQITADRIEVIDHNNLIDGYLALIDDIYQEDSGLNSDITMIAVDTTGWIELEDIEKEIIKDQMKDIYGTDIIEGTFEELSEQGIIDKDNLYFPNGILIKISDMKYDKEKKVIKCSIEKWRSGLGAIGSNEVTAAYKDGKWTITKNGMWIS